MMAGHGVFHVQYGMNETPLTRALEDGDFEKAEEMIRNCTSASYLDEGCYSRTPLYIALHPGSSGMTMMSMSGTSRGHEVNLYIAKLLVECGADPNIRIPITAGAEFLDAGQTPLQLLIGIHSQFLCCPTFLHPFPWQGGKMNIIGLNKKHIGGVHSKKEFQEDICQLCSVLIGYGAVTNVVSTFWNITPVAELFLTCQTSLELLELFLQNGADMNFAFRNGCTPLMSLCSGSRDSMENMSGTSTNLCTNKSHHENSVKYLEMVLEYGNVELDKKNKKNQTALFIACALGKSDFALKLLQHGASVDKGGVVVKAGDSQFYTYNLEHVSPLFVSFSSRQVCSNVDAFPDYPLQLHGVEALVDTGKFVSASTWEDFSESVQRRFPKYQHLLRYGTKLIHLMFGNLTSDLVQKSTRTMFRELCSSYFPSDWKERNFRTMSSSCQYTLDDFQKAQKSFDLHDVLSGLELPKDLFERFEMEWLRFSLCAYYSGRMTFDTSLAHDIDTDEEDDEWEDESDMEFW